MKATKIITTLLFATSLFGIQACKDKDKEEEDNTLADSFNGIIQYNAATPQTFTSNSFSFDANVNISADDTLMFEGERTLDSSYLYFNVINDDISSLVEGDTIDIPYDAATGTSVWCAFLIKTVSSDIFNAGVGAKQGELIIQDIDYATKYIKGKVGCTLYSGPDSLRLSNGSFKIDL